MSQQCIQTWIERIICHIQEVICLDRGNEYYEGKNDGKIRKYKEGRLVEEV